MATFVGIASSDSNFSILVDTLGFIDANLPGSALVSTLNDPSQNLTVFAPTNAAFGALAADLGFAGDTSDAAAVVGFLTTLPVELLNTVVTYHVAGGALEAADIAGAASVTTLQGGVILADELPTLTDLEPDLLNPTLVATDIAADNGVLHVIDRVLIPVDLPDNDAPSITGIVAASGGEFDDNGADFDLLLNAVLAAGLDGTLDGAGDFTVFAPNDDAFVGLAQALGFSGADEGEAFGFIVDALTVLGGGDPIPLLTAVLTYHVTGESLQASQVLASDTIVTLQGGSLTVDGTSLVDADPGVPNPNIIATDIQASNGIVHVIDGVLLPIDVLSEAGSDLVIGDDGRDNIRTNSGPDFVNAKGGNDNIRLGSGDDVALAGAGNDKVAGQSGNDTIKGEAGNDKISGNVGDDMLDGGDGNDKVFGNQGNDVIMGGAGNDHVSGGAGNDTVDGGTGDDHVVLGKGEDTFVFKSGDGFDTVLDFNLHDDVIDLSDLGLSGFDALDLQDVGHSTILDLGNGDGMLLMMTNVDHLTADQFIF